MLKDSGALTLLLENQGFVVIGGCGASEDEAEQADYVKPGADDKVFRLDRKHVAECRALEDSRKPMWAALGAPLRERFDTEQRRLLHAPPMMPPISPRHPEADGEAHRGAEGARRQTRASTDYPYYNFVFRVELKNGKTRRKENALRRGPICLRLHA